MRKEQMDAQIPQTKHPLRSLKDRLVELAEDLSIKLESQLDPNPTIALEGVEHQKARHRYLAQAKKIEAELVKLSFLVERFQVHSV